MLRHRLIFGAVLIGVLLGLLSLDGLLERAGPGALPHGALLAAVVLLIQWLGGQELARICRAKGVAASTPMLALAGAVGAMTMYGLPALGDTHTAAAVAGTGAAAVLVLALVVHSRTHGVDGAVAAAGAAMLVWAYLGTLPGFYLLLRREQTVWVIVGVVLVVKACDIGAYFTGRALGRHKLIPWLSPGKTWEGLAGGLIFCGLVAAGLAWLSNTWELAGRWATGADGAAVFAPTRLALAWAVPGGVALGLVGQAGDLIASLFKRDAGVKDSGASMPGFGGVLDVLDSPIVAGPVAYWLIRLAAG